jgi:NAD-dependent deacetylase
MLPEHEMQEAWRAAELCNVFLVIGTSGVVYPAAQLPALARQRGAHVIEINPERSALSDLAEVLLLGPSGEVLPQLLDAMHRDI